MSVFLPPPAYEPMRKNRFLVIFPPELNIEPFFVRSITLPKMEIVERYESSYFSRVRMFERVNFSDCVIKMMPSCGDGLLKKLMDYQMAQINDARYKNFNFSVQMLDPTGMVVDEYLMLGSIVKEIQIEKFDYADDDMVYYNIRIAVSHFNVQ